MVNYDCFRCGYCTPNKSYMRLHLFRKNICKPILRDINLDQYREDILDNKEFAETGCCDKSFQNIPFYSKNLPKYSILFQKFKCS